MTVNVPKRWSDFDVANNVSANDYFLVTNSQTGNTARVNMFLIGQYLATITPGALQKQGGWDASAGTPPSTTPQKGQYWIVTTAGTTSLSGYAAWQVNDWAIYDGTKWDVLVNDRVGLLLSSQNLADVGNVTIARSNLGLGTAAVQNVGYFATAAQGTLAATAVQPGALSTVATSGAYSDLSGKPSLFTNPMSAVGSLIIGGTAGAPTELKVTGASAGWVATFNGTTVAWAPVGGDPYFVENYTEAHPTIGTNATDCLAIGGDAFISNNASSSIVVGRQAFASYAQCVSVGAFASGRSSGNSSGAVAIGYAASIDGSVNGTAIGWNSYVGFGHPSAVALGASSQTQQANSVSVGAPGSERTITCVHAGVNPTDAVNISQITPATVITAIPSRIGLFAVVAGIGYMSTGTASTADWKQITN